MIATIKAYAFQIALGVALLAIGYLGIRLVSAEFEVTRLEAAVATEKAKFSKYVTDQGRLTGEANQKNRDLEWSLVKLGKDKDKEKADALEALNTVHAAAIASLQHRATRPTRPKGPSPARAVPAAAGPSAAEQGCGREQLYREDAEVVIGLGRAIADLRIELLDVRTRYANAQRVIDDANAAVAALIVR